MPMAGWTVEEAKVALICCRMLQSPIAYLRENSVSIRFELYRHWAESGWTKA